MKSLSIKAGVIMVLISLTFSGLAIARDKEIPGAQIFRGGLNRTGFYNTPAPLTQGKIAWKFKTNGPVRSAPCITKNGIYFGSDDGHLYSIDQATGKLKWKYKTDGPVNSSPAVENGVVVFGSDDCSIYALDVRTGKLKWKYDERFRTPKKKKSGLVTPAVSFAPKDEFDFNHSSPAVYKGTVYVGCWQGDFVALSLETGKPRWTFKTQLWTPIRTSPAISGETVFFGDWDGNYYALNAKTGKKIWSFQPENMGQGLQGAAAVAGGYVVFGSRDCNLYALDLRTGKKRWRVPQNDSWILNSPAVAEGMVYTGSSYTQLVQAVDLKTGKERWKYTASGWVHAAPAIAAHTVYCGSSDNEFFALDARSGAKRWSLKTGGPVQSTPVIDSGFVYFGCDDGILYAVR